MLPYSAFNIRFVRRIRGPDNQRNGLNCLLVWIDSNGSRAKLTSTDVLEYASIALGSIARARQPERR